MRYGRNRSDAVRQYERFNRGRPRYRSANEASTAAANAAAGAHILGIDAIRRPMEHRSACDPINDPKPITRSR